MEADFEAVKAAQTRLKTEAGAVAFIAEYSGLQEAKVLRIYRAGQPWPLTDDPAWDFDRQAAEAGVDWATYMAGMASLLEMDYLDKLEEMQRFKEKAQRFKEKVIWGEQITPEEITAIETETSSPLLDRHLDTMCNLTGEPLDIVVKVARGAWAIPMYILTLLKEAIESRERQA